MLRKLQVVKSIDTYSDEELIIQMHSNSGNQYAGELFKRYTHLVFGVCMKYLKNKAVSKDVMMDIFEILLKKPPAKDILSFKKWLLTITKNKCLTYLRDTKRSDGQQEKFQIFFQKSEIFMENEDVWSLNSRTLDQTKVLNALKQLKAPQIQCIRLFYIEGKSYKEIEQQTDFDLNQIKSFLQNGKRKLKLLFEKQG